MIVKCDILILGEVMKEIRNTLIKLAKNNKQGFPFAACLYDKTTGNTLFTVNRVIATKDPTAHAEIMALRELYHFRQNKNIILISSGEPCSMCLSAIAWAGIKEVYYIDSYKIANKKGYQFDFDSQKLNKFLNLNLIIYKL